MKHVACDVAVIGAGTAGLAARDAAVKTGAHTILIESGPGGTTCASVGCMPSKLLIAAAKAAYGSRQASTFGIRVGDVAIDGQAVMARLKRERDSFVEASRQPMLADPDNLIRGRARFLGETSLAVDDHTQVRAKAIVIATGAMPAIPDFLESVRDRVLTNETIFELDDLPESLAVIGAGPLGIEIGQAMARLGVRTVIYDEGEAVAGAKDPAIARCARELLGLELDLRLGVRLQAERQGGKVRLRATDKEGHVREDEFACVLAAAGRPPNTDGLDLGKAGVPLNDKGGLIYDTHTMRCGETAIFVAGDCDQDRPVLHEARREGEIAGENAARLPHLRPQERGPAFAMTFCEPQIATIGAAPGEDAVFGEASFADQGRARIMGENAGLVRLHAGPDGILAGGEMIGPEIEHAGHLVAWAVRARLNVRDLCDYPFYHPTVEEALKTAIDDLLGKLEGGRV